VDASQLVGLHILLSSAACLTMIGIICSLERLPFPNEEFDFVFVVTCRSLCDICSNAITCRHIKRIAHGIPEDKVSVSVQRRSISFDIWPTHSSSIFRMIVGFFIRGDFPGDEAGCSH
jgi:hypothetical protein